MKTHNFYENTEPQDGENSLTAVAGRMQYIQVAFLRLLVTASFQPPCLCRSPLLLHS